VIVVEADEEDFLNWEPPDWPSDLEVHVIRSGGNSPGESRNSGFLNSKDCPWVVYWDCDDIPDICEVYRMIVSCPTDKNVAIGKFLMDSSEEPHSLNVFQVYSEKLDLRWTRFPGLWRMAFRKNRIESISFSSSRVGEDQAFLFRLNLAQNELFEFSGVVYRYRYAPHNGRSVEKYGQDILLTLEEVLAMSEEQRKTSTFLSLSILANIRLSAIRVEKRLQKRVVHFMNLFLILSQMFFRRVRALVCLV
jgi:glycosyltransferase involved in cell wall biosynthesis